MHNELWALGSGSGHHIASKTANSKSEAGPQAIDTIIHTDFRCRRPNPQYHPHTRHTLIVNI